MNISDKKSRIFLAVVIVLSLALSTVFMMNKQGYHEDELLTYNLANSANTLKTDGEWNSGADFIDYLSVSDGDRFNYEQVYENQIIDASHPPFYYGLVHTVCSLFPNQFSKYFAFSINVLAMAGILIMLFKIVKRITKNNLYAHSDRRFCVQYCLYYNDYLFENVRNAYIFCAFNDLYEPKNL